MYESQLPRWRGARIEIACVESVEKIPLMVVRPPQGDYDIHTTYFEANFGNSLMGKRGRDELRNICG